MDEIAHSHQLYNTTTRCTCICVSTQGLTCTCTCTYWNYIPYNEKGRCQPDCVGALPSTRSSSWPSTSGSWYSSLSKASKTTRQHRNILRAYTYSCPQDLETRSLLCLSPSPESSLVSYSPHSSYLHQRPA